MSQIRYDLSENIETVSLQSEETDSLRTKIATDHGGSQLAAQLQKE